MPRSASRPSSKKKTSRPKSALRLRTKGSIKKMKKKSVSIGSKAMDTANIGATVHGRTQSLKKLAQRRASLTQDPDQPWVRRPSVTAGSGFASAAEEMAAAVTAMEEEEQQAAATASGEADEAEMGEAPGLAKTDGTALTQGEIAFVEAMMAKYGDGTSDGSKGHGTGFGYKKMAKDREINVTGVTAGGCKRLFARCRKQRQAAAAALADA